MIKRLLNTIRNVMIFQIRYPWIITGRNVHCQWSTRFWSPHRHIVIGDNVGIGHNCVFQVDIEVGNKVLIGGGVAFINSDDHRYDIVGKSMWDSGRGDKYSIAIEDDVWIGERVIVLSPARIGRGSIVAAGSVVKRDVPRYSVVVGVPARPIRMRFTPEQIVEHERLLVDAGELDPADRSEPR